MYVCRFKMALESICCKMQPFSGKDPILPGENTQSDDSTLTIVVIIVVLVAIGSIVIIIIIIILSSYRKHYRQNKGTAIGGKYVIYTYMVSQFKN